MRILIHIGGAQNGLNTAGSGEVRYALNMAELMALAGHDVWAWGAGSHMHEPPQWGSQTPIEGITFCMLKDVIGQKFDLVLNCPMEFQPPEGGCKPCTELPVQAKLKVLTSFSWNQQVEDGILKLLGGQPKQDFVVGIPYPPKATAENKLPHIFAPFPYFKGYYPLAPEERNQITWACKDVYSDNWDIEKEIHFVGQKCLEAIKNLVNEYDLTLNIVTANTNVRSNRAKRYCIPDILSEMKHVNLVDGTVPMDTMNDWLSKSRFSIILPGYAGSAFNSIACGCPTIFFEGRDEFTEMLGKPIQLDRGINSKRLETFLSQFMDAERFELWVNTQRKGIEPYSYKAAYTTLMKNLGVIK